MPECLRRPANQDDPVTRLTLTTLEGFQQAVGGWIEVIRLPAQVLILAVNEDDRENLLPVNERATWLLWW